MHDGDNEILLYWYLSGLIGVDKEIVSGLSYGLNVVGRIGGAWEVRNEYQFHALLE